MQYKIGNRIHASYQLFQCGFCSRTCETLEKVAGGGWRCLQCVRITGNRHQVEMNSDSPTALTLHREYVKPLMRYEMHEEVINECLNCRRPYKVDEVDERGFPLHVRFCNDCVKHCPGCDRWLVIRAFLPNKESIGYKDWIGSIQREGDTPLGILIGRENYLDQCAKCQPFPPEKIKPEKLTLATPNRVVVKTNNSAVETALQKLNRVIANAKVAVAG